MRGEDLQKEKAKRLKEVESMSPEVVKGLVEQSGGNAANATVFSGMNKKKPGLPILYCTLMAYEHEKQEKDKVSYTPQRLTISVNMDATFKALTAERERLAAITEATKLKLEEEKKTIEDALAKCKDPKLKGTLMVDQAKNNVAWEEFKHENKEQFLIQNGVPVVFIPVYETLDNKEVCELDNEKATVHEGDILVLAGKAINGTTNDQIQQGMVLQLSNVFFEKAKTGARYLKFGSAQVEDMPAVEFEFLSISEVMGNSLQARRTQHVFEAAVRHTLRLQNLIPMRYSAPEAILVSSINTRFVRYTKREDTEMKREYVPGLVELLKWGPNGKYDKNFPKMFIKNTQYKRPLPEEKNVTLSKEQKEAIVQMRPTNNKLVVMISNTEQIHEDDEDIAKDIVVLVNVPEFNKETSQYVDASVGDTRSDWPVCNRDWCGALEQTYAIDRVFIASRSSDDVKNRSPEAMDQDERTNTGEEEKDIDIIRPTISFDAAFSKVFGNWFGCLQNYGLLLSKDFATKVMLHLLVDRYILSNISEGKESKFSNLNFTNPPQLDAISNLDEFKKKLSLTNPLNTSKSLVRFIPEYETSSVTKDSVIQFMMNEGAMVSAILTRAPSYDHGQQHIAATKDVDTAVSILSEFNKKIFGSDIPLTAFHIFVQNMNFIDKCHEFVRWGQTSNNNTPKSDTTQKTDQESNETNPQTKATNSETVWYKNPAYKKFFLENYLKVVTTNELFYLLIFGEFFNANPKSIYSSWHNSAIEGYNKKLVGMIEEKMAKLGFKGYKHVWGQTQCKQLVNYDMLPFTLPEISPLFTPEERKTLMTQSIAIDIVPSKNSIQEPVVEMHDQSQGKIDIPQMDD